MINDDVTQSWGHRVRPRVATVSKRKVHQRPQPTCIPTTVFNTNFFGLFLSKILNFLFKNFLKLSSTLESQFLTYEGLKNFSTLAYKRHILILDFLLEVESDLLYLAVKSSLSVFWLFQLQTTDLINLSDIGQFSD